MLQEQNHLHPADDSNLVAFALKLPFNIDTAVRTGDLHFDTISRSLLTLKLMWNETQFITYIHFISVFDEMVNPSIQFYLIM